MTDQRDDSKTQEPAKATPAPAGDDAAQQKSARKDAPEAKQDKPETGAGPVLTTQDMERMKAGEDAPRREGEVRIITEVNPGTAN